MFAVYEPCTNKTTAVHYTLTVMMMMMIIMMMMILALSWGRLGRLWERLGAVLELSWGLLGPLWGLLGGGALGGHSAF